MATVSVSDLAARFSGRLLQPTDAGYEDARRVHNGLIDKRPSLIAQPRNSADIADAVKLAHDSGFEVAVKGGGHNVAGRGTIDNGLLIDLSLMKGIHVDARNRTARVQGGATWKEYNRETQLHGLASTGGVISSTGIAGLTLGGGLGWLMPKFGMAVDNLRSVELVTADGNVLTASKDKNPDRSGPSAAVEATSASHLRSNSTCIRSDRSSPAALSRIHSHRRGMSCDSSATRRRRSQTK